MSAEYTCMSRKDSVSIGHIHSVNTFQFVIFATRTLKLQSSLLKVMKEQTAWQMAAFQPCWTTPDGTVCQESLYTEDEVLLYRSTRFDIAHKKKRDKQFLHFFRNKLVSYSTRGCPFRSDSFRNKKCDQCCIWWEAQPLALPEPDYCSDTWSAMSARLASVSIQCAQCAQVDC